MYSILNPNVIYQDTSSDVTEHDIDVVSDLWEMDGHSVYRGSRDPRYTHANVYWLYNEDLERVGCSEHNVKDQADFRLLWFRESEFGTLLQEEGWTITDDLWSYLPRHTFDRAFNEGWTMPHTFLEHCLYGSLRVLTWKDIVRLPTVYSCSKCGARSLTSSKCRTESSVLDIPQQQKVFFVDEDMMVHIPPSGSSVWFRLQKQLRGGDSSHPQTEQAQAQESQLEHSPLPPHALPHAPPPEQVTSEQLASH